MDEIPSSLFWRPGSSGPGIDVDTHSQAESTTDPTLLLHSLPFSPANLAIHNSRREFLYRLEQYSTIIVQGETGSGKSTQLIQYLHKAGWTSPSHTVVCTQPRKVAAISVAQRVAQEQSCELGALVGYRVRWDNRSDLLRTRMLFVVDEELVRETLVDPLLTRYSVVIVDEAHERSLSTDLLLGLLKKIQRKRPALRIVISSATLDTGLFHDFFHSNEFPAHVIQLPGNRYPVQHLFLQEPCKDYVTQTVETVLGIHRNEGIGDILVFLTGRKEIERVTELLQHSSKNQSSKAAFQLYVLPMYSGLPLDALTKVMEPSPLGLRKCIVSTNVCETSLTIPGITFVVDCGFVKHTVRDVSHNTQKLAVVPISQASAFQRAGRAGRTLSGGKCFHLYTEESFKNLAKQTIPELQRTDLTSAVLQLKALGVTDITSFDFISPPDILSVVHALEQLHALAALDDQGVLTDQGQLLAEMPLEPRLAKLLVDSCEIGCSEEVLTMVCMAGLELSTSTTGSGEKHQKKFWVEQGDMLTAVNIFNGFISSGKSRAWCAQHYLCYRTLSRADHTRRHLRGILLSKDLALLSCYSNISLIERALVKGFVGNAAQLQRDGTYKSVGGVKGLEIHPSSVLYLSGAPWIIYREIIASPSGTFLKDVCKVDVLHLQQSGMYEFSVS